MNMFRLFAWSILVQIPNYLSEPHLSNDRSYLTNEIVRLTREKNQLQDLLDDLKNILKQPSDRTAPER